MRRDGKPQYLQHIPRTWGYLARNLRVRRAGAAGGVVRPPLPTRGAGCDNAAGTKDDKGIAGMAGTVEAAMVLGAGLGTRMAPAANGVPKPLVQLHGKALIDHVLDRLAEAGIARAVVNVHLKADQIERHLSKRKCTADRDLGRAGGPARHRRRGEEGACRGLAPARS